MVSSVIKSFIEPHLSKTNNSYNTLDWILVSHYPYDVITISTNSPPDADLGDVFTQPPAEQILQVIYNIKNTHDRQIGSLTAI